MEGGQAGAAEPSRSNVVKSQEADLLWNSDTGLMASHQGVEPGQIVHAEEGGREVFSPEEIPKDAVSLVKFEVLPQNPPFRDLDPQVCRLIQEPLCPVPEIAVIF